MNKQGLTYIEGMIVNTGLLTLLAMPYILFKYSTINNISINNLLLGFLPLIDISLYVGTVDMIIMIMFSLSVPEDKEITVLTIVFSILYVICILFKILIEVFCI